MANDFSNDSNCVALYRFESGAMTTDSKGSNTLSSTAAPDYYSSDKKEGAGCAHFTRANNDIYQIVNSNLSSNFPCKGGTSNLCVSFCVWLQRHSAQTYQFVMGKMNSNTNLGDNYQSSWYLWDLSGSGLRFDIGYANQGREQVSIYSGMQTSRWYHVGCMFDASDKSYIMRVWDDTAQEIVHDDSGTHGGNNMVVGSCYFTIGAYYNLSSKMNPWDGYIDEAVIFNDRLTKNEIDCIRKGNFPPPNVFSTRSSQVGPVEASRISELCGV